MLGLGGRGRRRSCERLDTGLGDQGPMGLKQEIRSEGRGVTVKGEG